MNEDNEKNIQNDTPKYGTKKKKLGKKGIIAICVAGGVLIALALVWFLWLSPIFFNPQALFAKKEEPVASVEPVEEVDDEEEELSEYDKLLSEADKSMMDGILNVVLVGVDHSEERDSDEWSGKHAFHSDVILVLAINFNENKVDMISIPRDTYAKIPDVKGIYKINASMDLGGGMYDENGGGFKKVCETAEWMLGGIDVDYYVGVDMNAVKDLGNAIGGVDFDLEVDFNLGGRYYKKGYQHMDGQGILDYMRVRKPGNIASSHQGDQNRINRQKKMLVAVFNAMKQDGLLLKIPDIINAFDGNLFTNLSGSQMASLAVFGYNLNSENITMNSMGGTTGKIGEWNFCFTNQSKRVELIEQVYGVKVDKYTKYTEEEAFKTYTKISGTYVTDSVQAALDEIGVTYGLSAGGGGGGGQPSAPPQPTSDPPAPTDPPVPTDPPAPTDPQPTVEPQPLSAPLDVASAKLIMLAEDEEASGNTPSYANYSAQDLYTISTGLLSTYKTAPTIDGFNALKAAVTELCKVTGYSGNKIKWYYPYDTLYNEIYVDFR